jgi:hypothetical protein
MLQSMRSDVVESEHIDARRTNDEGQQVRAAGRSLSLALLATLNGAVVDGMQSVSSEETGRSVRRMLERLPY